MEIKRFLLAGGVVASVDMKNLKVVALNKGSMDLLAVAKNMKVENATVIPEATVVVPESTVSSMDEQVNASIDAALGAAPAVEIPQPSLADLNSQPLEPSIEETLRNEKFEETPVEEVAPIIEPNKTKEELLMEKLAEVTALIGEIKKEYEDKLNLAYMQLATEKQRADKAEQELAFLSAGINGVMSENNSMRM